MFDKLKEEMARRNKRAYTLAKEADITPSDLYSALKGDRPFYPNWRKRIANALDTTVEQLFDDEGREAE